MFQRIILMVLDSVGIGAAPDAHLFDDTGSDTLGHIIQTAGIKLPNLCRLGLGNIVSALPGTKTPLAAYGIAFPRSAGKDTIAGHWEIMGVILDHALPVYPNGFPDCIIDRFCNAIGRGVLGNVAASGTEIIRRLGREHILTGKPIVYTSSDSVFQLAAHESIIPVEQLYEYCKIARDILQGKHAVGRVIARPFTGKFPHFVRTPRRKDFSLEPPQLTVLDRLYEHGIMVYAVGKIYDIFAGRGISDYVPTSSNSDGIKRTVELLQEVHSGLIFVNLVDFDMKYGHRRDPYGYARALQEFDRSLPKVIENLRPGDCLIITADHGNDPTFCGTDHTREKVPVLVYGQQVTPNDLGQIGLVDIGATVADNFIKNSHIGQSFLMEIEKRCATNELSRQS